MSRTRLSPRLGLVRFEVRSNGKRLLDLSISSLLVIDSAKGQGVETGVAPAFGPFVVLFGEDSAGKTDEFERPFIQARPVWEPTTGSMEVRRRPAGDAATQLRVRT